MVIIIISCSPYSAWWNIFFRNLLINNTGWVSSGSWRLCIRITIRNIKVCLANTCVRMYILSFHLLFTHLAMELPIYFTNINKIYCLIKCSNPKQQSIFTTLCKLDKYIHFLLKLSKYIIHYSLYSHTE